MLDASHSTQNGSLLRRSPATVARKIETDRRNDSKHAAKNYVDHHDDDDEDDDVWRILRIPFTASIPQKPNPERHILAL